MDFLEHGRYPDDPSKKVKTKRKATKFIVHKGVLCKQSLDGILFRYIWNHEILKAINEVQSSICGAQQSWQKLDMHLKRLGYYWQPTMICDYMEFAERYQVCQYYGKLIKQPWKRLRANVHTWPFAPRINIVGPFEKVIVQNTSIL